MTRNTQIYTIDGNIGVGKSTLLKHMKEKYFCYEEPVDKWTMLKPFYENNKVFSFPLQYQILLSQYEQMIEINKLRNITFIERNSWTSKNVFLEHFKTNSSILWSSYHDICYNELFSQIDCVIHTYYYLYLSPDECFKRIKNRNRYEEEKIRLDYLISLDDTYNKALFKSGELPFRLVVIDVKNKTPSELFLEIEKDLMKQKTFV